MVRITNLHDGFLEGPVRLFDLCLLQERPEFEQTIRRSIVQGQGRAHGESMLRRGGRLKGSSVHKSDPYRVKRPQE